MTHSSFESSDPTHSFSSDPSSARTSRISGFRDLSVDQRLTKLAQHTSAADADLESYRNPATSLPIDQANAMIENVVSTLAIPVGMATNFTIDGTDYLVPMATEEPSVVAAASNAARMARAHGGFTTSATAPLMIAQVQIVDAPDPHAARLRILERAQELLEQANQVDQTLVNLGGGARNLTVRLVTTRTGVHVVCHLTVDVRDAMGANAVNSMAESLAPMLASLAGGRVLLRILSNKADQRLVRTRAVFDKDLLGGPDVVDDIVHASAFAEADPYRAATHNKGIMNGISAVVLATGNDTRAVEAGCHSHAIRHCGDLGSMEGTYSALSSFEKTPDGHLCGTLEVPMPVGLVGGATKAHPQAQTALKILGVSTAVELASIIGSVGLAQNLAACRALAAEGIQRGHMSLHARMIATSVGATSSEVPEVAAQLIETKNISTAHAEEVLTSLRTGSAPAGAAPATSSRAESSTTTPTPTTHSHTGGSHES